MFAGISRIFQIQHDQLLKAPVGTDVVGWDQHEQSDWSVAMEPYEQQAAVHPSTGDSNFTYAVESSR